MGGDAAFYFDPDNIEEVAAAMEKLVSDSAFREKMIASGLQRAQRFSWETTVSETIEVMKKIVR